MTRISCKIDWEVEPRDRRSRTNDTNYYFPDRYPDLKTVTLIFVLSSLGLILLISALIILLYKIGARARQQRELQSRLETISELLGTCLARFFATNARMLSNFEPRPWYIDIGCQRATASANQRVAKRSLGTILFRITDSARIDEISISDDPPGYEAPPGYEEITRLTWPKKARSSNRGNSPSQ